MKTKTLAQVDGIIGIIAGAVLAILPFDGYSFYFPRFPSFIYSILHNFSQKS